MSTNNKPEPLRISLKNVRLSYPALFRATAIKQKDGSSSKPKFQATFLLNKKDHAEQIANIQKAIERAQLDKFGKVGTLKNVCLKDGEEKEDTDGYGPEVMSIIAKNDNKPTVVTGKKEYILSKEDGKPYVVTANAGQIDEERDFDHKEIPYGGCYVNASIEIFAYKHDVGGKGVSASLRAVQFAKDGQPFGAGKVDVDEEFETVEDEDPAFT